MLTSRQSVRVLGTPDLAEFLDLADADPVVNVFASHRARTTRLDPRWMGGEVWGRFEGGRLRAACHVGANLVPVQCDQADAAAFGQRAARQGRVSSTIVGPSAAVAAMWEPISRHWAAPREIRWSQPHLEIARDPDVAPDPLVRLTTRGDLDALHPARVAMYLEEVGVSPNDGIASGDLYHAQTLQLIARGWSLARFEAGRVVFKAEVACVTPYAAQVQGVWVPPDRRGEGLATHGMAAVVQAVRRDIAPVVSLYVNDWNGPARAAYAKVGFEQTATFSTIMF